METRAIWADRFWLCFCFFFVVCYRYLLWRNSRIEINTRARSSGDFGWVHRWLSFQTWDMIRLIVKLSFSKRNSIIEKTQISFHFLLLFCKKKRKYRKKIKRASLRFIVHSWNVGAGVSIFYERIKHKETKEWSENEAVAGGHALFSLANRWTGCRAQV
jgi:hypothetical protein